MGGRGSGWGWGGIRLKRAKLPWAIICVTKVVLRIPKVGWLRNRFTRSCNTIYCPKIVVTNSCFDTKYLIFAVIYVCNTYLGCLDQRFCNTRLFHITLLFFSRLLQREAFWTDLRITKHLFFFPYLVSGPSGLLLLGLPRPPQMAPPNAVNF